MPDLNFPEIIRDQILAAGEEGAKRLIEEWIHNGQPEDLYVDFTEKKDPSKGILDQDDKRGFAKAVSGFANSDGGLLVWGVLAKKTVRDREAPDKAQASKPVSPLDTFVGELNALVANSTKPVAPGVQNLPVWDDRHANRGWLVSYVPVGPNPPYRAEQDNNNHFYMRAGSSFYPMEPYNIRDVVFRFHYPKIQLDMGYKKDPTRLDNYWLLVEAHNAGPRALQQYKVQVLMPRFTTWCDRGHSPSEITTSAGKALQWEMHSRNREPEEAVIYPGERRELVGPGGLLHVCYALDSQTHRAIHESPDRHVVVCRLYGVDMPPLEIKRPMCELEDY